MLLLFRPLLPGNALIAVKGEWKLLKTFDNLWSSENKVGVPGALTKADVRGLLAASDENEVTVNFV